MKRLALFVPIAALAACAHSQKIAEVPPAAPAAPRVVAATAAPTPMAEEPRLCTADAQCDAKHLCIRSQCVPITAALEECGVTRVHFDFDQSELHPLDFPKLQRVARCLGADRRIHVLIEGNADERGTVEYNLALGDRRANRVEKYLENLGVPQAQLATVTDGKEMPLCTEHNETCWAENRRAALLPNGSPKSVAGLERYEMGMGGRKPHQARTANP